MDRTAAYFSALKFHFARNIFEYRMNPRAAYRAALNDAAAYAFRVRSLSL